MSATRRAERGAATLETAGAYALVGVLVVALATLAFSGSGVALAGKVRAVACTVSTLVPCGADGGQAGADQAGPAGGAVPSLPAGGADTGGRGPQERQTAKDRTGRHEDKSPADQGTPGTPVGTSPLGDPVPGTTVPEPQVPPWEPPDEGSGPYASEEPTWRDRGKELLIEALANAAAVKWPDAARNLLHFLGNTGEPLQQDVDAMLAGVPRLASQVAQQQTLFGEAAVKRARASGATGPVTYPVSTGWTGFSFDSQQDRNWFLALGSMTYNQTGQVTVLPPQGPGEPWRYEVTTRVNLYDQYNWDGSKATEILGRTVTDSELQRLHRVGLAREYRNEGRSTRTTTKGTVG